MLYLIKQYFFLMMFMFWQTISTNYYMISLAILSFRQGKIIIKSFSYVLLYCIVLFLSTFSQEEWIWWQFQKLTGLRWHTKCLRQLKLLDDDHILLQYEMKMFLISIIPSFERLHSRISLIFILIDTHPSDTNSYWTFIKVSSMINSKTFIFFDSIFFSLNFLSSVSDGNIFLLIKQNDGLSTAYLNDRPENNIAWPKYFECVFISANHIWNG